MGVPTYSDEHWLELQNWQWSFLQRRKALQNSDFSTRLIVTTIVEYFEKQILLWCYHLGGWK